MDPVTKLWRVAISRDGSSRHTDYITVSATTPEEAERIALARPRVLAVKWVGDVDPTRKRS